MSQDQSSNKKSIYDSYWSDDKQDDFEFGEQLLADEVTQSRTVSTASDQTGIQLSLGELFFIVTLSAVAFWLYHVLSPTVAFLVGGAVIFFAIMKRFGRRSLVMGGLIGCGLAELLAFGIGILTDASMSMKIALLLLAPCFGYVFGGLITELAEDDSI